MGTCARCGAELGAGRYCTNCGHRIGAPVPAGEELIPWSTQPQPTDEPDEPLDPRVRWFPWVAGAALLVVLVLVLLSWLGEADEGDPATPSTGEPTPTATAPTESATPEPRGRARDVARHASVQVPATAPDTRDLDGTLASYAAAQMVDGDPTTAWRMPGDATGRTVTFRLARPTEVVRVGLVNGYAKQVAGVSWYPLNRRTTAVEWAFDDGTVVRQDLALTPALQRVRVGAVTTTTVRMTILGVTGPGPGSLGRDYTAISEVSLVGRPG